MQPQGEGVYWGGSTDPEQQRHAHVHAPFTNNPNPVHTAPVYIVGGVQPAKQPLPCCGIGFGWMLFILGWFLTIIPWYIGGILFCVGIHKKEPREKAGLIACLIGAVISTILIVILIAARNA